MSTLRISDAPLLPDVDGTEKIPTGGRGDYAISVDQIKGHIFQDIGKELVGLGNVDNTSDLDKPVSIATQNALNLKADKTYVDTNLELKADKTNVYTRSETTLALSTKADLVGGVIPSNQLPSYVDDVVEYTTSTLPIIGESGKIYITTDTNRTWRWSGNQYVEISNGGISDSTLKLQTSRKIANVDFDGTQNIEIPHNNLTNRNVSNAHTASSIVDGNQQQDQINLYGAKSYDMPSGGYPLDGLVRLSNGDIVKSTIASNSNNPNVDMTGWVFLNNGFTVQSVAELRNVRNPKNRMEVSVNSYTAGSGVGGGLFYADTDDTISIDNGVTIFVGVDGTRWKRKNSILNFAMAGCTGSGDETVALNRLFSLLAATGGTVIDMSGMSISFSSNISCVAPNKKIVLHSNVELYSDTASISISGEIAEIGVISANASAGSMSVSASAVGDISVGDVVALHNTRLKSFAAHRDYYTDGEFKTVKSVSGNVLNFNQSLETSYSTADTNKVYKISPVTLDIDGLTITSNGVSALDVSLSCKSKFNFNANNLLNTANSQRAFMLDRSYDCEIIGGRYVKLGVSGNGTDYGIVFANCQDIRNNANYCYGGRHAVATGGTALQASVPCRRVNTIYSELVNDTTSDQHVADFHGNTSDSYFSNCTIHGRVALGGFNTKSTHNIILMQPADIRSPVGLGEVVGGEIASIGDKVVASGSAQYITTFLTSSNALLVTKPAVIKIQDITFNGSSSLVGILATTNLPVASRWILDGFELAGSAPSFNRLVNYLAGSATVKPDYFQITRPKYPVPESMIILNGDGGLVGITKQAFPQSGSNANGKWSRQEDGGQICRHKITTTTPITTATTGGFRSPDILWTYPKGFVVEAPTIVAMSLDASLSIGATNPTTASASMYVLSPSSIASASVSFDVLAIGRHLF